MMFSGQAPPRRQHHRRRQRAGLPERQPAPRRHLHVRCQQRLRTGRTIRAGYSKHQALPDSVTSMGRGPNTVETAYRVDVCPRGNLPYIQPYPITNRVLI